MDQFMQKNIGNVLFRNVCPRQHNAGTKKADQHRGRDQRMDAELNRLFDAYPLRHNGKLVQRSHVGDRRQPGAEISDKALVDGYFSNQQSQRGGQPDQSGAACNSGCGV